MPKKLTIYTDGGARGNPGPAGVGVVIMDGENKVVATHNKYLGEKTNNQAEYEAVILALQKTKSLKTKELEFYLDSELVVNQLNQQFKIKDPELGRLFVKIWNLQQSFKKVTFKHVRREKNQLADKLVNQAIDDGI